MFSGYYMCATLVYRQTDTDNFERFILCVSAQLI